MEGQIPVMATYDDAHHTTKAEAVSRGGLQCFLKCS